MTEIEKLKQENEELKKQVKDLTKGKGWYEVKRTYLPKLQEKFKNPHLNRIENAVNTLIRYALGLRKVADLTLDDAEKAKEFVTEMLDVFEKYSDTKKSA